MTATAHTQGQSQPQVNSETKSSDKQTGCASLPMVSKFNLKSSCGGFSLNAYNGKSGTLELSVSLKWLCVINGVVTVIVAVLLILLFNPFGILSGWAEKSVTTLNIVVVILAVGLLSSLMFVFSSYRNFFKLAQRVLQEQRLMEQLSFLCADFKLDETKEQMQERILCLRLLLGSLYQTQCSNGLFEEQSKDAAEVKL